MDAIMAVYPRHKAVVDKFKARGEVIGVGPFTDRGNMAIFRTRQAAEEFAREDPFIAAGLTDLWPFGVHAQSGHIEGHRGLDLSAGGAVIITSPVDGTVFSIDNAQDSSGTLVQEFGNLPSVRFTTIVADCGLSV